MKKTNKKNKTPIFLLLPLLCLAWRNPAFADDARTAIEKKAAIAKEAFGMGSGYLFLGGAINTGNAIGDFKTAKFLLAENASRVTKLFEEEEILNLTKSGKRRLMKGLAGIAGAPLFFAAGAAGVVLAETAAMKRAENSAAIRTERDAPQKSPYYQTQGQPDFSSATASAGK